MKIWTDRKENKEKKKKKQTKKRRKKGNVKITDAERKKLFGSVEKRKVLSHSKLSIKLTISSKAKSKLLEMNYEILWHFKGMSSL